MRKVLTEVLKAAITAALAVLGITLQSCGITRATISRPQQGTVTTVTITTNNPITTDASPNVNLDLKK